MTAWTGRVDVILGESGDKMIRSIRECGLVCTGSVQAQDEPVS